MPRTLVVLIYVILFLIAIPWYWDLVFASNPSAGQLQPESIGNSEFLFGLPLWFCVSVITSLVISFYTAVVILLAWKEQGSKQVEVKSP